MSSLAQSHHPQDSKITSPVSCSIRIERKEWSLKNPAIVYITVESTSDTPVNIPLWSLLSLAPLSPYESLSIQLKDTGKIAAGVEPRALKVLEPQTSVVAREEKAEESIRLRFNHKHEKANFELDARDLIWDYEVVSRPPTAKLFSIAKPGSYDVQFQMWWESGSCESSTVRLAIQSDDNKR